MKGRLFGEKWEFAADVPAGGHTGQIGLVSGHIDGANQIFRTQRGEW